MIAKTVCIEIPGLTSAMRCEPAYVLPLFAARVRENNSDGDAQPRVIPFPADMPASARSREVDSIEYEAERLRQEFGPVFTQVYPTLDMFERSMRESLTDGRAVFEQAVAQRKAKPVETLIPATAEELTALANLDVDGMTADVANALANAGLADIKILATANLDTVAALPGVGKRLAKRILDAAVKIAPTAAPTIDLGNAAEDARPARMLMSVSAPAAAPAL